MSHEPAPTGANARAAGTHEPDAARRGTSRAVWLALLLIVLVGCALRGFVAWDAAIISPDSALFIDYAQRLAGEPLAAMRAEAQHPLFPAWILALHAALAPVLPAGNAGWIAAGLIVTQVAGVACTLLVFVITRRLYDASCGLLAAGMFTVLPDVCQLGGDVLSDLPHLAFYLLACAAALRGLTGCRRGWLMCGAASGLAFLTRPEGASVVLIGALCVLLQRDWRWSRRLGAVALAVAAFVAMAAPYQIATGKLVPKKSLPGLFGVSEAAAASAATETSTERAQLMPARGAAAPAFGRPGLLLAAVDFPPVVEPLYQWVRGLRGVFFVFAMVGVWFARPGAADARFLLLAIGFHLLLLYALVSRHDYIAVRHALPAVVLALPLAGAGLGWLVGGARRAPTHADADVGMAPSADVGAAARGVGQSVGFRGPQPTLRGAAAQAAGEWWARSTLRGAVVVVACGVALLPWSLRRLNADEAHLRAAAEWVRANAPARWAVVGDARLRRVGLYADRRVVTWPAWGRPHQVERFLREQGLEGAVLAFDRRRSSAAPNDARFFEALERELGGRAELLATFAGPEFAPATEVRVYRWLAVER